MVKEIKNVFVSPWEAFEIVGQETYGNDWTSDIISKPNSTEYKVCYNSIKNAFLSGSVEIYYDEFDGIPHKLTNGLVLAHGFGFSMKNNEIREFQLMPRGARCEIHADQLRNFIQSRTVALEKHKSNSGNEMKFKKFLLAQTDEDIRSKRKAGMMAIATSCPYKIGTRAFQRCWKALVAQRSVHGVGGRPRNPPQ